MGKKEEALAVAKERLIREGELYRVATLHAKYQMAEAMHPDKLLHGAVEQAIGALQSRLGGIVGALGGGGGGLSFGTLRRLLPFAVTVASYVGRKRLVKPALAAGVLVAVGVAWLLKRKPPPDSGAVD